MVQKGRLGWMFYNGGLILWIRVKGICSSTPSRRAPRQNQIDPDSKYRFHFGETRRANLAMKGSVFLSKSCAVVITIAATTTLTCQKNRLCSNLIMIGDDGYDTISWYQTRGMCLASELPITAPPLSPSIPNLPVQVKTSKITESKQNAKGLICFQKLCRHFTYSTWVHTAMQIDFKRLKGKSCMVCVVSTTARVSVHNL